MTTDNTFDLTLSGQSDTNGIASVVYEKSTNGGSTWTSTAANQSGLADGDYLFHAVVTDSAGNASTTSAIEVKVDNTAPTAGTLSFSNLTDSGTANTPPVTTDNTFDLTLSGQSDTNGIASVVYEKSTNGGSTWTSTAANQSGLADGDYLFHAVVTDSAGNASTTSAIEVKVDNTNPAATMSSTIGTDTGSSSTITSGGLTKDNTLALSGTVSDANGIASVHIFDGATDLGAATVSNGNWSFTSAALADGSHSFTSKSTDNAGNSATTAAVTATTDTIAPSISSVTASGLGIDGGGNGNLNASTTYWSTGNNGAQLIKFDINSGATTVVGSFSTSGTFGLAFAPDGSVYTLLGSNATLAKVNLANGSLTAIGGPGGSFGYALDFAKDGTLYAVNVGTNAIYTVNTTTGAFTFVSTITGPANSVMDITFDQSGHLYAVGPSDNKVYSIDLSTGISTLAFTTALSNLMGIAADNAGNLIATSYTNPSSYEKINLTTATSSVVGNIGAGTSLDHGGDIQFTVVTLNLNMSEAVTVSGGTPVLTLNDGGTATYASGSGTNTLTFKYTVATGQNTSDLSITGINLNGASINDTAGNAANLAGVVTNPAGVLQVDTLAPTVSSEAITSATGIQNSYLNAGDVVSVTVAVSESVTVTGTPQLALNVGGTIVQANYSSGSGSSSLVFTYTIQSAQTDTNGISINANALSLNGGTITDAAGNAATLTAAAVTDNANFKVDTTAPTVAKTGYNNGQSKLTGTYSDSDSGVVTVNVSDTTSGHLNSGNATLSAGTWTYINANLHTNDALTIVATDAAGNQTTLNTTAPAGVAGESINLGLVDLSIDHVGATSLVVGGIPSNWNLNEGTNNGDGSWTVVTNDVASLSITSPANYVGAMVLNVTETWTNAGGTTGAAIVADTVEAYAPGMPIFAWSGDDVLTGSQGNDLFVFSQPIGNDTVHSFDTAADKIDLIGYSGFQSFADVQAHMADDGSGNAVITLADGQSITLDGVHSSALTDGNFVFDQTPMVNNPVTMTIGDGAMLPLSGTINNSGIISLDSSGSDTLLQLIQHGITLQGGGQVVLSDSDWNVISGTGADVILTNVDNTISGAGQLGGGLLSLNNQGTIIATGTHALVIDTGSNTTVNSGTLEATGSGGLMITGTLANSGLLWANGGNITIDGQVTGTGEATIGNLSKLEFGAASSTDVVFAQNAAGTLQLDDSFDFSGRIGGMTNDDKIDLGDILFGAGTSAAYQADTNGSGGTLTVTDGAHNATLHLLGIFDAHNFTLVDDGAGRTVVEYGLTASVS
ncbi:Autotransporter-associated beta strand repeat protein [Mesorhizobium loti]|nr:Autotransporter-associated beta strand repeat protein [Mesorhizobium loti]